VILFPERKRIGKNFEAVFMGGVNGRRRAEIWRREAPGGPA
jgi:hypothetical protein